MYGKEFLITWANVKFDEKRFNQGKLDAYLKAIRSRSNGDLQALVDNRIECLLFEMAGLK